VNNVLQILQTNNPLFYLVIAWAVIWKGIALWHAARNRQLAWYIALLIVNTAGILEIVYLIFFRKKGQDATL
jgi:methionyl-tRNA synthetase